LKPALFGERRELSLSNQWAIILSF